MNLSLYYYKNGTQSALTKKLLNNKKLKFPVYHIYKNIIRKHLLTTENR